MLGLRSASGEVICVWFDCPGSDSGAVVFIDGYLQLLENLSPGNKLDLISRLTLSVKTDITQRSDLFFKVFGAWESTQTADEIINEINKSRNTVG